jgi:hypothetical protein
MRTRKPAPRLGGVLSENAVISTAKGRAEIHFGRGDRIFLDKNSSIRVNRDSRTDAAELEILAGSAVVHTGGLGLRSLVRKGCNCRTPAFFGSMSTGSSARTSEGLQGRRRRANAELHLGADDRKDDRPKSFLWRSHAAG